jgi:hypothetical protein
VPDTVPAELREYAETPDRYALLGDDVERRDDGRACVLQGAAFATVSGVAVDVDELGDLVAAVRARVPAGTRTVWSLGPATPRGAAERLVELGLVEPADGARVLRALALLRPPPASPPGVDVTRISTIEDALRAAETSWEAFGTPAERRRRERPHLEAIFRAWQAGGHVSAFLATLGGEPAGVGRSVHSERGSFLIGGAVLPWARGRGVYRALVRARWEESVARGRPVLVTHARPDTSYPILKRLGFVDVCELRRLEDSP